jgi:hypothetical protein
MIFSIDKETALVAERCHLVGTPSPVERRNFGETDSEVATFFFFCGRRRCIKPAFLQKDPEEQKNYKEALLLDPDEDEELGPSVARRCRCSASRLG